MKGPDQRAFEADIEDGPFRISAAKGKWGLAEPSVHAEWLTWPHAVLWVAAARRCDSPERFHVRLDCKDYPSVPPTGIFFDVSTKAMLPLERWPKGKGQVGAVFRTDSWQHEHKAFYHPYDRVAAQSHGDWAKRHPHLVWSPATHTIVDFLSEFHDLLHSPDYSGVK